MRTAIVSSKDIGTNCWSAARFCCGRRCARVMRCNYPEKRDCPAVQTEIDYLEDSRHQHNNLIMVKLGLLSEGRR